MSQVYQKDAPSATECALCSLPSKGSFCCKGCEVVFSILEKQGKLAEREEHPLYREALRSGLISGGEEKQKKQADGERLFFEIEGMWCPSCGEALSLLLERERGVKAARVDYTTDLALVIFDPKESSKERLFGFVKRLGYRPLSFDADRKEGRGDFLTLLLTSFFAFNVMMAEAPLYANFFGGEGGVLSPLFAWLALFFSLPLLLYSAYPIWRGALLSLRVKKTSVELLAAVSILSAFSLSLVRLYQGNSHIYLDSLAALIAFLVWGRYLEKSATKGAKERALKLFRTLPKRARLATGEVRLLKEIEVGEQILLAAGDTVSLDGVLIRGALLLDTSSLTGEPHPQEFLSGMEVKAGFRVIQGGATLEVTKRVETSTLTALTKLVEGELLKPNKPRTFLEQIAKGFISATLLLALLSLYLNQEVERALSILLIACPCTIGIAIPLVEARFREMLGAKGIFLKDSSLLFSLAEATDIIFDKTGTLTKGDEFILSGLDALTKEQQMRFSALAAFSHHPLSKALAKALPKSFCKVDEVREIPGFGIEGVVEKKRVRIGSHRFTGGVGTHSLYLEEEGALFPVDAEDQMQKEAYPLISALSSYNLHLFSGDREGAVCAVAKELGISSAKGEMTPLEKQKALHELKKRGAKVIFVGDGMNDAPSLSAADVGITFGKAADLTQESAALVFLRPSLLALSDVLSLAKKGKRIAVTNLIWSFSYNAIGMGIAFLGWMSPLYSVLAMTMSSLIVITRSQFLQKTAREFIFESLFRLFNQRDQQGKRRDRLFSNGILEEGFDS